VSVRPLTDEELQDWLEEVRWIWAKTYAKTHPHHYCLKRQQDPRRFERAVLAIWQRGYDRRYLGRLWRSLDVGPRHYCWIHTDPREAEQMGIEELLKITILVNRAELPQDRVL
jgi:hypothetical protein